jgi:hypothetical protein
MKLEQLNGKATPTGDGDDGGPSDSGSGSSVRMKKEIGLLEGVAVILGIIFGSGM